MPDFLLSVRYSNPYVINSASAYCIDATDPTPTITGLTGGTFSSTAVFLINVSSGVIDLSASLPNTYNITYTTAGDCSNTATTNITLNNNPTCMIYYACTQDSIDATAVLMAANLLPQEIRAKLFITSDGVIPAGDQYDFYAGRAIELTPGFTVEQDGVLHAIIESCIATLNAADPWRE